MAEPKTWFDNAAARITTQANLAPGELAGDRDTGNVYRRTVTGWADLGLGGGGGAAGVSGTLVTREATLATSDTLTKSFDFGSDIIKSVRIEIVRTSLSKPAIPAQFYAIVKTAAQGVPVAGDFTPPADFTGTTSRIPLQASEDGTFAIVVDTTSNARYVGIKTDVAQTPTYRIFVTAGT